MDVLSAAPPQFSAEEAALIAAKHFGVEGAAAELQSERDQNFRIDAGDGAVLKISNAAESEAVVEMEIGAALHAKRADPGLPIALPVAVRGAGSAAGDPATYRATATDSSGTHHLVRLYELVPGEASLDPLGLDHDALRDFGRVLARLGRSLRGYFHPAAGRALLWDLRNAAELRPLAEQVGDPERRTLLLRTLDRFQEHVAPRWPELRSQVIHGDLSIDNVTLDSDHRIAGIIDFGDMSHTALVCDVSSAWASLAWARRGDELFAAAAAVLDGYREVTPLEEVELELLADLFATRAAATAAIAARRVAQNPDNDYVAGFDTHAWPLLELFEELGPDECRKRLGGRSFTRAAPIEALLARRRRVLGSALTAPTYERPLHLVGSRDVWMFDPEGNRYLDAYNNVPVIGHCHPRVVEATARQARNLNTNMRYLHEAVIELGERLVDSMPAGSGLDTVMMVNSGTEANDLAWRLARRYTGNEGALASSYAYHGISSSVAELSPEGSTVPRPERVALFNPPPESDSEGDATELGGALGRLSERGIGAAAIFVDAAFTSDGVLPAGAGYLDSLIAGIHAAGGLYVADEVQIGHGRSGEHLWSFGALGVCPDIVTMGKPMGNGYPVAAVVTRAEIAHRFAEEGDFFSTFGGNPPAAVAGLTVLDVIADERLIERAGTVGGELRAELGRLAEAHAPIAAVRGWGQMTGLQLRPAEPGTGSAAELATRVANGLKERGVLVGSTGPDGDVLKIRPPLTFGAEHVTLLIDALDGALGELR